jgi:hypothetical protein
MKLTLIIGVLILVSFQSCSRNKNFSKVILPNGEIRQEMTIGELKEIDRILFSQYKGFLFQDYVVLTEDPYIRVYNEMEINELENARIIGFRKNINLNSLKYRMFEDSLINIFKVIKTKKIKSELTVYSNNEGVVFSILKKQSFIILTISNKNEILIPPL